MTDLQTIIDQNCSDLSDPQAVLDTITTGSPSIWSNYWGASPPDIPTLLQVQAAITVVQPIKDGRAWVTAATESVLGGTAEGKTIDVLKAEIVEFNLPS